MCPSSRPGRDESPALPIPQLRRCSFARPRSIYRFIASHPRHFRLRPTERRVILPSSTSVARPNSRRHLPSLRKHQKPPAARVQEVWHSSTGRSGQVDCWLFQSAPGLMPRVLVRSASPVWGTPAAHRSINTATSLFQRGAGVADRDRRSGQERGMSVMNNTDPRAFVGRLAVAASGLAATQSIAATRNGESQIDKHPGSLRGSAAPRAIDRLITRHLRGGPSVRYFAILQTIILGSLLGAIASITPAAATACSGFFSTGAAVCGEASVQGC